MRRRILFLRILFEFTVRWTIYLLCGVYQGDKRNGDGQSESMKQGSGYL